MRGLHEILRAPSPSLSLSEERNMSHGGFTTGATERAIASTRLSAIASPISMKPTGNSPDA